MKRQLRIAVVQLAAHDREEFSRIAPELLEKLRDCCVNGAQLIVFPEGTIPGYVLGPAPLLPAEYTSVVADIQRLAHLHSVHIVGGLAWPTTGSAALPHNAAGVFQPDGRLAIYAKRFLWHFDQHWYCAGTGLAPIETSIGKLGVMVCADGRIPTIASALVDQGAEILVMPTAWVTSGADDDKRPNIQADLMARMRAWENGVPFAAANKVGVERDAVMYCGKSQIVSAEGTIIAVGSAATPEILWAEIDLGPAQPRRSSQGLPVVPHDTDRLHSIPNLGADDAQTTTGNALNAAQTIRIGLSNYATDAVRNVARWSEIAVLLIASEPAGKSGAENTPHSTAENALHPAGKERAADLDTTDLDYQKNDGLALAQPTIVRVAQHPYNTLLEIQGLPLCICDDDAIADPAYLAAWRLRGCLLAVWRAQRMPTDECVPLARLRAIELRIYIAILDEYHGERCLLIDPDGVVLAGTTRDFHLAQGAFEPQKILATSVAPGTDILAGLRAVQQTLNAA